MTADDFQKLSNEEKKIVLFEAKKIGEKFDGNFKQELFVIDDFYVESTTNGEEKIRRTLNIILNNQMDETYLGYRQKLA